MRFWIHPLSLSLTIPHLHSCALGISCFGLCAVCWRQDSVVWLLCCSALIKSPFTMLWDTSYAVVEMLSMLDMSIRSITYTIVPTCCTRARHVLALQFHICQDRAGNSDALELFSFLWDCTSLHRICSSGLWAVMKGVLRPRCVSLIASSPGLWHTMQNCFRYDFGVLPTTPVSASPSTTCLATSHIRHLGTAATMSGLVGRGRVVHRTAVLHAYSIVLRHTCGTVMFCLPR